MGSPSQASSSPPRRCLHSPPHRPPFSTAPSLPSPGPAPLRICRTCGRGGCPGACWGFWKQEQARPLPHESGGGVAPLPAPLALGGEVERGPDWRWGQQDGGEGKRGVVVEVQGYAVRRDYYMRTTLLLNSHCVTTHLL
jgi:hypothetical protein